MFDLMIVVNYGKVIAFQSYQVAISQAQMMYAERNKLWRESTTNPVEPCCASRHRAVSRNWPKM